MQDYYLFMHGISMLPSSADEPQVVFHLSGVIGLTVFLSRRKLIDLIIIIIIVRLLLVQEMLKLLLSLHLSHF